MPLNARTLKLKDAEDRLFAAIGEGDAPIPVLDVLIILREAMITACGSLKEESVRQELLARLEASIPDMLARANTLAAMLYPASGRTN